MSRSDPYSGPPALLGMRNGQAAAVREPQRRLVHEPPLLVLPTLATAVGLNEAIFVQQLHYWLQNKKVGKNHDGRRWIYNSIREWRDTNFPFWSESTIDRVVVKLADAGIILTANLNRAASDRTKWYTIDYECLERTVRERLEAKGWDEASIPAVCSDGVTNLRQPSGQDDEMHLVSMTQPIPETTEEITTTTNAERAHSTSDDNSPFVTAFKETFPGAVLTALQAETICAKAEDMHRWEAVLEFWALNEYSPRNLHGILDRYEKLETAPTSGDRAPRKRRWRGQVSDPGARLTHEEAVRELNEYGQGATLDDLFSREQDEDRTLWFVKKGNASPKTRPTSGPAGP